MAFDIATVDMTWGATSTQPDGHRPCWKLIWNAQVPQKVKMLAWKICSNGLATQDNMARMKMATTNPC
jgi:hypothetical protein